jgi:hypothetical protein
MTPSDVSDRREYSRADAYIPLTYRLVPQEEQKSLKSRFSTDAILAHFNSIPPPQNHPQIEYLSLLDKKIDSVIEMLTSQYKSFYYLPFKYVTISGNGMKLSSRELFLPGDILEFKMLLSLTQTEALIVYGNVISVEKQTNGYYITVSFLKMDEAVQDSIIRFVFEMERELLRETRTLEKTSLE